MEDYARRLTTERAMFAERAVAAKRARDKKMDAGDTFTARSLHAEYNAMEAQATLVNRSLNTVEKQLRVMYRQKLNNETMTHLKESATQMARQNMTHASDVMDQLVTAGEEGEEFGQMMATEMGTIDNDADDGWETYARSRIKQPAQMQPTTNTIPSPPSTVLVANTENAQQRSVAQFSV